MKKYFYLGYDLLCVCVALVAALYLRHGIPLIQEGKPEDLYLLLEVTFVAALFVFPLMQLHTGVWRYTSTVELANIMIAVALVVLLCNGSLFLISRLHMMPRSVPPMHWAIAVGMMGGSRVLARRLFGPVRQGSKQAPVKQHVLVVGVGHTAELYLQFVRRIVQHPVVIEGFVDSDAALTHRMFQKHKILGTPSQLPQILEQLRVHGIHVRQLVLTQALDALSKEDRKLLQDLKREGVIDLINFAKHLSPQWQPEPEDDPTDFYQNVSAIAASEYEKPEGLYPYAKRWMDVLVGLVLLVALSPLMVLTATLVAIDVGFPILFWQQRPGLYGKPFRLYKFRTMRPAGRKVDEDRLAHKSADGMRTSWLGKLLRMLRLDELPQLFHIVRGTMSFVGPRPLLPDDQPEGGEMRLSVRPGVTGWAQIHGGDALSAEDKLVLDVWYIRHMSFWLDMRIMVRTLIVVFKKDKPKHDVIAQMRKSVKGIKKTQRKGSAV